MTSRKGWSLVLRGALLLAALSLVALRFVPSFARALPSHGEAARAPRPTVRDDSPWASPEACRAALGARGVPSGRAGVARLAAWNVRWFPDGGPGKERRTGKGPLPTNVQWLACAIAWLELDVLALSELKSTPEASSALAVLRSALDGLTRGEWRAEIDRCPGRGRQSVAFLYDAKRVRADSFRNVASLNPHGGACDQNLRPGFGGYFRFPGGADAHLVVVHLKSGPDRREYDLRQKSLGGIVQAYQEAQGVTPDTDVVLLGDFNTMGCPGCSPKVASAVEIRELGIRLTGLPVPFRVMEPSLGCSEYYRGEGTLLDHFAVTRAMQEVPSAARSRVDGYCSEVRCSRLDGSEMPRAYRELSDHCPVVLDLTDRDLD